MKGDDIAGRRHVDDGCARLPGAGLEILQPAIEILEIAIEFRDGKGRTFDRNKSDSHVPSHSLLGAPNNSRV